VLKIRSLDVAYGGLKALSGVSLDVEEGQLVAVVGPNGAGKTTLFKTISGVVTPLAGEIVYKGRSLLAVPPYERAKLGIAHVPEGRQVFASMTVMENLEMGAYARRDRRRQPDLLPSIIEIFPILAERRHQLAGTLSGGEQQMLAIARAMMAAPKLLMLDEPTLGLAPIVVHQIGRFIGEIRSRGTSVIVAEQNAEMALAVADRAYVLENGAIVLSGKAADLARDPAVQKAFLGL
jgi:branched-chain amino acid transport system ATP-binding protein